MPTKTNSFLVPEHADLERAYSSLLHQKPFPPKLDDILRFAHWSRFDPRLAEIWVAYVTRHWPTFNPIELRSEALKMPRPAVIATLLEFVRIATCRDALFGRWSRVVTHKLPKAPDEQFFIGLRPMGGSEMRDDAAHSLDEYRRWGFLSRENLAGKPSHEKKLSPQTRQEILKNLLQRMDRVRVTDYWHALGKCISLRQAERDLKKSALLQRRGRTKGTYFVLS